MESRIFQSENIATHNSKDDLWLVIDGEVYDLTDYVSSHPGGEAILRNAGGDASAGFHSMQAHKYVKGLIGQVLKKHKLGKAQQ